MLLRTESLCLLLQSCSQKLGDWLQENILTIVGMDVGLIFIQVTKLESFCINNLFGSCSNKHLSQLFLCFSASMKVVDLALVVFLYQTFGRKSALKRRNRLVDQDHSHSDQYPDDDLDYGEENQAYIDRDGRHSDLHTMNHGGPHHIG